MFGCHAGPNGPTVIAMVVLGVSIAASLWKRHRRAAQRILMCTVASAAVSRAILVAFAIYDLKTIALLPVIDDLNHAMEANVSATDDLTRLNKTCWQLSSPVTGWVVIV